MSARRFAMRLRSLRAAGGLTQETLARKVRVSRGYVSHLELGRHDPPLSRVREIARALHVPVAELAE